MLFLRLKLVPMCVIKCLHSFTNAAYRNLPKVTKKACHRRPTTGVVGQVSRMTFDQRISLLFWKENSYSPCRSSAVALQHCRQAWLDSDGAFSWCCPSVEGFSFVIWQGSRLAQISCAIKTSLFNYQICLPLVAVKSLLQFVSALSRSRGLIK